MSGGLCIDDPTLERHDDGQLLTLFSNGDDPARLQGRPSAGAEAWHVRGDGELVACTYRGRRR